MKAIIATLAVSAASRGNQHGVYAYPYRAGTCAAGMAISGNGIHPAQSTGALSTAGYQVTFLNSDMDEISFTDSVAKISPGEYKLGLKASDSSTPFRGFLFRMGPKEDKGDAEGFFTSSSDSSRILPVDSSGTGKNGPLSTCNSKVAAFCHSNSEDKYEITNTLKATVSGEFTLDVTVVRDKSMWYYNSYTVLVEGGDGGDGDKGDEASGAYLHSFATSAGSILCLVAGWLLM